ncbi:hypothetical protein B4V02_16630 [Paenibacillus kribbensis]|uniref:Uncharacterized protein n=1 Tax=Paenibacillus kribbensis TaxID=172713 RepID=A0A222WQB6_9BACL|nr:hypothetical protein [Paenibacillus kribbensis]ASR48208.1 hypothetical protein B4V02_16630 [Paenibacillus kribbensis]
MAVIAGSVGHNDIIDSLVAEDRLDVSGLRSRRETYMIRVLERPCPELETQHPLTAGMHTLRFYVLDTVWCCRSWSCPGSRFPAPISAPGRAFARGDWVLSLRGLNHK